MQVWRFKAAQPGATEIKMAYYRPWEGAARPWTMLASNSGLNSRSI